MASFTARSLLLLSEPFHSLHPFTLALAPLSPGLRDHDHDHPPCTKTPGSLPLLPPLLAFHYCPHESNHTRPSHTVPYPVTDCAAPPHLTSALTSHAAFARSFTATTTTTANITTSDFANQARLAPRPDRLQNSSSSGAHMPSTADLGPLRPALPSLPSETSSTALSCWATRRRLLAGCPSLCQTTP